MSFRIFRMPILLYGVEIDKDGNPWFAEFSGRRQDWKSRRQNRQSHEMGAAHCALLPRRIEIDTDGTIWFR